MTEQLLTLNRARYYCRLALPVNFPNVIELLYLRAAMMSDYSKAARQFPILLSLIVAGACTAFAQAPAPKASPIPADVNVRATELPVDGAIGDDPAIDKMLDAYSPKVRELDAVLGRLTGELRKGGIGAGSMGNFVTDGLRWQAGLKLGRTIDLALMNGSGMRRNSINEGELRARDIFELLPFENGLVTVELTGEQLMSLLRLIVAGREAQSGAHIVYFTRADKTNELESAMLRTPAGNKEIDSKAMYRVVTIDYLVNVGGKRSAVLRAGKNLQPVGITLRDAIIAYVKSETAASRTIKPNLDGRFSLDRAKSAPVEDPRPN